MIDIDGLWPPLVDAIVNESSSNNDDVKALLSMFSLNHLDITRRTFIKTLSSSAKEPKTIYKNINAALSTELNIESRSINSPISNTALSASIKLLATAIGNIYGGNILYTQSRRLLKKIFSAPVRKATDRKTLGAPAQKEA